MKLKIRRPVRHLYSEETLDGLGERMRSVGEIGPQLTDPREILRAASIDRRLLRRTVRKGMEEYVDGQIGLRHGWVEKMMSGNPDEKREIYANLGDQLERMERYSEPYISGMRLLSEAMITALDNSIDSRSPVGKPARERLGRARKYEGARWNFDEGNVTVTSEGGAAAALHRSTVAGAYALIADGFMRLADYLNLMEAATDPEVCRRARSTNDFPEARIGKCFDVTNEIADAIGEIKDGYRFLARSRELGPGKRREMRRSLRLLKGMDLDPLTKATQWYAKLQFNEKPWNRIYQFAIGLTVLGVAAAIATKYLLTRDPFTTALASTEYTIGTGVGIYAATDAGPKTAKWLRTLGDFVDYRHDV
jgi:hypothetical protein